MTSPSSALRAPSPRTRGEGEPFELWPLAPRERGEGGRRPGEGCSRDRRGQRSSHETTLNDHQEPARQKAPCRRLCSPRLCQPTPPAAPDEIISRRTTTC